jgi:hypothetical protein
MSAFTEPLRYESTDFRDHDSGRPIYRIQRGFTFWTGQEVGQGEPVEIETGFLCDLGSVPGIASPLIRPDAPWAAAFVPHDKLYRDWPKHGWPREKSDWVLKIALETPFRYYDLDGYLHRVVCPAWQRHTIYSAVRLGGRYRPPRTIYKPDWKPIDE